jgi:hypothetical protein
MPSFMTLPASMANRPLLVPGQPKYVFGTYTASTAPTRAILTNVALTSNVATVSLTLIEGAVPTTNQTITVQGCSNSVFNIVAATVTAVSGFNTGDNSAGTVSYAVTHANVGSAAATAQYVVLPVAVLADALSSNLISQQVALPYNDPRIDQSRTIVTQVSFPSLPTSVTVSLQASDDDINYTTIGTAAVIAGGVFTTGPLAQFTDQAANFYRLSCGTVSGGTLPTIQATIQA